MQHSCAIAYALILCTDQTDAEFREQYLTYIKSSEGNYTGVKVFQADPWRSYPDSIDWRTKGAVTSVKNQVVLQLHYSYWIKWDFVSKDH